MPQNSSESLDDYRQKRTTPVRARSHASKEAIGQAAMALWRTKGFAGTTITDICKAAGVSKALFYVYFSRREDVLLEVEAFTMRDAHEAARTVLAGPYELPDVIASVIGTLETRSRRFPAEVIFEAVLETYRLEQRALTAGAGEADLSFLFSQPFQQAREDGKLGAHVDVVRAARIAQVLVADAIRCWAASGFVFPLRTAELAREITAAVAGIEAQ